MTTDVIRPGNSLPSISSPAYATDAPGYRGRLAPSPTGYLHLGHARTFWTAQLRARAQRGILVLREEDIDAARCRGEYAAAMLEDLHWFGLAWSEGPDLGGPFGPYRQSERRAYYVAAWQQLFEGGFIYPCSCSRKDVHTALGAPHPGEDELVYPGSCRHRTVKGVWQPGITPLPKDQRSRTSWRFRVPDGEVIPFRDALQGEQKLKAGEAFGDFVVWRMDDQPAYQLAVVVDDSAMRITEVVRGCDLLTSTARQLLLYRALQLPAPAFCHCPLLTDDRGVRLAKRSDAVSLRTLRQQGLSPEELRRHWLPPADAPSA
jgi:glutamyl/glutaminyl-tRNA synthetase